jgi:uncharacterized membrane protein YfcA
MTGLDALPLFAIVWIVLALAVAGLVHGTLGLGFPLVATPLIAIVADIKTAVVLVAPVTWVVVIAAIGIGGPFLPTLREWWRMPIWMVLGSLTGTYVFIRTDAAPLTLLLAAAILVYLGLDRIGRGESQRMKRHRHPFGTVFGFASGFFEGAVNIAAPPLLIYFLALGLAPTALVKILNVCFLTGKSTQISTLLATSAVSASTWIATPLLSVVGVATLIAGMRIRNRVDAATYRGWVKLALLAIAIILVVQFALRTGS